MCGIVAALPIYDLREGDDLAELIAAIPEAPQFGASIVADPAALDNLLGDLLKPTQILLEALSHESAAASLVADCTVRLRIAGACAALMTWAVLVDELLDTVSDPLWECNDHRGCPGSFAGPDRRAVRTDQRSSRNCRTRCRLGAHPSSVPGCHFVPGSRGMLPR